MLRVLDRERMELEDVAENLEVLSVGLVEVEPEEAALGNELVDLLGAELDRAVSLVVDDVAGTRPGPAGCLLAFVLHSGRLPVSHGLTLELRDATLEASDLPLGAHAAPAERPRDGELPVQLLKLATGRVELGIGRGLHEANSTAASFPESNMADAPRQRAADLGGDFQPHVTAEGPGVPGREVPRA